VSDWNIHRREGRCAGCERAFAEDEAIYSLLLLEVERLRREDRCHACHEALAPVEEGGGPAPRFFWRTRHSRDRRARFAVDFEAIEELFLSLDGRPEEGLAELRYLLSLLLLRKKRLKLAGVRRDGGGEVLCVRRPRRAEEFLVRVFALDSERARGLRDQLARVFDGAGVGALETGDGGGGVSTGEAAPLRSEA
jgi:hypothetical protein